MCRGRQICQDSLIDPDYILENLNRLGPVPWIPDLTKISGRIFDTYGMFFDRKWTRNFYILFVDTRKRATVLLSQYELLIKDKWSNYDGG